MFLEWHLSLKMELNGRKGAWKDIEVEEGLKDGLTRKCALLINVDCWPQSGCPLLDMNMVIFT